MSWPIVDLAFWNHGDARSDPIDALLADPATPLAKHGLTGMAAAYARETGAELHDVHREWHDHLTGRSLGVDGALAEVVSLLDKEGLPYFVAKGPVVAHTAYPDPGLRPYSDLDVYVAETNEERSRAVLHAAGYRRVDHATGALGGLPQEMHGGAYGATVELHAHVVDNVHRRHLPPVSEFQRHTTTMVVAGSAITTLKPEAHLALQAIHAGAAHRYAKLILLRDIEIAIAEAVDLGVVTDLGGGPFLARATCLLQGLGRPAPVVPTEGIFAEALVRSLLRTDPVRWDEYRLSVANILGFIGQRNWRTSAYATALAVPSILPRRRRRVSVRTTPPGRAKGVHPTALATHSSRGSQSSDSRLDIGVFGARGIPSTYSGFETFLTVLLPLLAERGHAVTMYCRPGGTDDDARGDFEGVERRVLPALETKSLSTLTHGAVAAIYARRARHDVVLSVNVANALFCGGLKLTGQDVVLNTDGQEWLRGKWGPIARRYFRGSARIARFCAGMLISDCEAMRAIYREQFGADSVVIPYCWTDLTPDPSDAALTDLGVLPYGYALIAGRLIPENNIDRIVETYVASEVSRPIVVLGAANYDSPVSRRLKELARVDSRIRLAGHVDDRSRYASLVARSWVYFHGHSVGGINPSLVEAMGCRARVVALDTAFNREALGDAGDYFGDDASLRKVLTRLHHEDPNRGDSLRELARERAITLFDPKLVAEQYEAALVAATNRRARRRS